MTLNCQHVTYKPSKLGHTDLLVCDQSLLVGLRMSDYKSQCIAVTIWANVVNTQTHTHILAS